MEAKPKARKAAPKPRGLPEPIRAELERLAEEILLSRTAEARKAAAVELACKLLATANTLLAKATGGATPTSLVAPPAAPKPPPPVLNPCVMCGRKGVWQDKPSPFVKGKPPWYCQDHAQAVVVDHKEEKIGSGLMDALRNAKPIDDNALPE